MRIGNISRFSVKDIFLCLLLGLSFLFSLEVLSTGVDEHARQSQWPFLYGEFGVIEIIQIFVLAFGLAINLRFRRLLVNASNKLIGYLRIAIFSFLIYEELSFLTSFKFIFAESFNAQSELNLHNASFWHVHVLQNIPIIGNIGLMPILTSLVLLFLGFGSFLPVSKEIKLIFFEKRYAIYASAYFLNLIFSSVIRYVHYYEGYLIASEYIELCLYVILALDSVDKVYRLRSEAKNRMPLICG